MQEETLTEKIIGCAFKVHNTLGPGYLEKVYENAMCIELAKHGLQAKQQQPVIVHYEGQVVGEYMVDLWVEDRIIVELKAVQALTKAHEAQLVSYLTAQRQTSAYSSTLAHLPSKLNANTESTSRSPSSISKFHHIKIKILSIL